MMPAKGRRNDLKLAAKCILFSSFLYYCIANKNQDAYQIQLHLLKEFPFFMN